MGVEGFYIYETLFIRNWYFLGYEVVVENTVGPHIAFIELNHFLILFQLWCEVVDNVSSLDQSFLDKWSDESWLSDFDAFIFDHYSLRIDGVDGSDS